MSTQTDVDIEALVGALPDVPCEHSQHGTHTAHTDEAASHYVHGRCPTCNPVGLVYPACPGFVEAITGEKPFNQCQACRSVYATPEFFTILGPVNK